MRCHTWLLWSHIALFGSARAVCAWSQIPGPPPTGPQLPCSQGECGDPALLPELRPVLASVGITGSATAVNAGDPMMFSVSLPIGTGAVSQVVNMPINLSVGLNGLNGTPTNTGTITGMVPVSTQVMPHIDIDWSVRDANGGYLERARWFTPSGTSSLTFPVRILPPLVELTSGLAPTIYTVRARVRLRLGETACVLGATCTDFRNVDVPIAVMPVAIPTVAVFFQKPWYQGHALLVVPKYSPVFSPDNVLSELNGVYSTINRLREIVGWAALLPETGLLAPLVNDVNSNIGNTELRFKSEDEIPTFTVVKWDDHDADDYFDSVILFGISRRIECYSDKDYNAGRSNGWFYLTNAGLNIASRIGNLDHSDPESAPTNAIRIFTHDRTHSFHHVLSSIKFGSS
jgi:hypothetical protein